MDRVGKQRARSYNKKKDEEEVDRSGTVPPDLDLCASYNEKSRGSNNNADNKVRVTTTDTHTHTHAGRGRGGEEGGDNDKKVKRMNHIMRKGERKREASSTGGGPEGNG